MLKRLRAAGGHFEYLNPAGTRARRAGRRQAIGPSAKPSEDGPAPDGLWGGATGDAAVDRLMMRSGDISVLTRGGRVYGQKC